MVHARVRRVLPFGPRGWLFEHPLKELLPRSARAPPSPTAANSREICWRRGNGVRRSFSVGSPYVCGGLGHCKCFAYGHGHASKHHAKEFKLEHTQKKKTPRELLMTRILDDRLDLSSQQSLRCGLSPVSPNPSALYYLYCSALITSPPSTHTAHRSTHIHIESLELAA